MSINHICTMVCDSCRFPMAPIVPPLVLSSRPQRLSDGSVRPRARGSPFAPSCAAWRSSVHLRHQEELGGSNDMAMICSAHAVIAFSLGLILVARPNVLRRHELDAHVEGWWLFQLAISSDGLHR
jgi:hypothetical protein